MDTHTHALTTRKHTTYSLDEIDKCFLGRGIVAKVLKISPVDTQW